MSEQDVENCTKQTIVIEKENYYLLVGDDFAMVTVPRENDPAMSKTRMIAEMICDQITNLMQTRIGLTKRAKELEYNLRALESKKDGRIQSRALQVERRVASLLGWQDRIAHNIWCATINKTQ